MIAFVKWAVRFVVWILLYYIIASKIATSIFDSSVTMLKSFNLIVFIVSIVISFLSSFWNNLISWKNLKYHAYSIITLGFLPMLLWITNICIKFINWIGQIVDSPELVLPSFKLAMKFCNSCNGVHLNGLGIAYLAITGGMLIVFFLVSYDEYYLDSHYHHDSWDDDLE